MGVIVCFDLAEATADQAHFLARFNPQGANLHRRFVITRQEPDGGNCVRPIIHNCSAAVFHRIPKPVAALFRTVVPARDPNMLDLTEHAVIYDVAQGTITRNEQVVIIQLKHCL